MTIKTADERKKQNMKKEGLSNCSKRSYAQRAQQHITYEQQKAPPA
jgi:hypothetical protein